MTFALVYVLITSTIGSFYIGTLLGRAAGWLVDKIAEEFK